MDLVFPVLQGLALAGLLIGLGWIVWEQAVHPIEPSRGAPEPQWRFVPPDPRETLIVVTPPAEPALAAAVAETEAVIVPGMLVDEGAPRPDRGVVTGLQ